MKVPIPNDESGLTPEPQAFFLHSGAYSSFVLAATLRNDENLLAPMEDGDLWGSDCVQLNKSAVFFSLGSDAVNQAIWVYLDAAGKADLPERSLHATFLGQGEPVYLHCIEDVGSGEGSDHFFLPEGEYEVRLLSWNLERARDNFDADPKLFSENVHHELHFTSAADGFLPRRTIRSSGQDGHMLDDE